MIVSVDFDKMKDMCTGCSKPISIPCKPETCKLVSSCPNTEVKDVSTALEKLEKIMGKPWPDIEKIEYMDACEEAYKILKLKEVKKEELTRSYLNNYQKGERLMAKVYVEKQKDVTKKKEVILKLREDLGDVDVMLVDENGDVINILLTISEGGKIVLYPSPELQEFGFSLEDDYVEVERSDE